MQTQKHSRTFQLILLEYLPCYVLFWFFLSNPWAWLNIWRNEWLFVFKVNTKDPSNEEMPLFNESDVFCLWVGKRCVDSNRIIFKSVLTTMQERWWYYNLGPWRLAIVYSWCGKPFCKQSKSPGCWTSSGIEHLMKGKSRKSTREPSL